MTMSTIKSSLGLLGRSQIEVHSKGDKKLMFDPNLHPLSTTFIGREKLKNKFRIIAETTGS